MKISTIIPVYNSEKYLKRCLDSVINQKLDDLEIICIDDGSTDGSLNILRDYESCYDFVHVISQENKYAGVARNAGLEIAKGKYIHFMDSDDYLLPNSYEKIYELAHKTDADYVKAKAMTLDLKTGKIEKNAFYSMYGIREDMYNRLLSLEDCPEAFLKTSPAPWMGFVNRKYIDKYQMKFNNLICTNDRSFYANIISHTDRLVICNEFMVYHQINNSDSLVGIRNKNFECHVESYKMIREIVKDVRENLKKKILGIEINDLVYWYQRLSESEKSSNDVMLYEFISNFKWEELDHYDQQTCKNIFSKIHKNEGTNNMDEKEMIYCVEQLNDILKRNVCMLYGAGRVAKTVIKYASKQQLKISGILVSDKYGNPSDILGIPVVTFTDYKCDILDKHLIIAMKENLHEELENKIELHKYKKVLFVSNKLYEQLTYLNGDYELDNLHEIRKEITQKLDITRMRLLRFVPRPCLEYMVLNILDHCNLKCKGCDHFACITEPYFVSYESIHRDLDRLSEIFHGDHIMQLAVMGGEPLLHPDLLKILEDVRNHFPYVTIRLTTNGILLLKQDERFWSVCRENNVTIVNTKYPINLDYEKMKEKAKSEGVEFIHFKDTGEHTKTLFKKIINLKGDSNPVDSFANCNISNYGNFLMEGKLYGCPFSCQSYRIFNKKYNQNLRMTERDFLDIYKVKDMQEVFDFAARPKYYCRYCKGVSERFQWERSKMEINEWIEEE